MREKFGGNNGSVTSFEPLKQTGWLAELLFETPSREGAHELLYLSSENLYE